MLSQVERKFFIILRRTGTNARRWLDYWQNIYSRSLVFPFSFYCRSLLAADNRNRAIEQIWLVYLSNTWTCWTAALADRLYEIINWIKPWFNRLKLSICGTGYDARCLYSRDNKIVILEPELHTSPGVLLPVASGAGKPHCQNISSTAGRGLKVIFLLPADRRQQHRYRNFQLSPKDLFQKCDDKLSEYCIRLGLGSWPRAIAGRPSGEKQSEPFWRDVRNVDAQLLSHLVPQDER